MHGQQNIIQAMVSSKNTHRHDTALSHTNCQRKLGSIVGPLSVSDRQTDRLEEMHMKTCYVSNIRAIKLYLVTLRTGFYLYFIAEGPEACACLVDNTALFIATRFAKL